CAVPGCSTATITVNLPVQVTVQDSSGNPISALAVTAIDTAGNAYNMGPTDSAGQVTDALVTANYSFRVTYNGTNFFSAAVGHCAVPGCTSATITVTLPTTVTVVDGGGAPQAGLQVWWQDGVTTTYVGLTNASGQVTPSLPNGSYRFRVLYSGTYF